MVQDGALYLDNTTVISLYNTENSYKVTVQDALYNEFKNARKIAVSTHFRGGWADVFKSYIQNGAINIITECLDISSDLDMFLQLLTETFCQYETAQDGRVDEGTLDYINQTLNAKENTFNDVVGELNEVMQLASQYIETSALYLNLVNEGYASIRNSVKRIREDLYSADDSVLQCVNELYDRIASIKNIIEQTLGFCYNSDGRINVDNIGTISTQDWYKTAGNVTLLLLLEEDPFIYSTYGKACVEAQWATGLYSDVYAYAGYSIAQRSYEVGIEDDTAFAKAKGNVLAGNAYAQFTDYLVGSAMAALVYGEGDAKIGLSEEYVGFHINGEVGLAKAEGSLVLGTEDFNAFINGEAKGLYAEGKAAFEFEDDGEFAIGVDLAASLGSASAGIGTSFLYAGYEDEDKDKKKEELFGISADIKADAGADFAFWLENKKAFETDWVDVYAFSIKLSAALGLGGGVEVTVPLPYFKWPW